LLSSFFFFFFFPFFLLFQISTPHHYIYSLNNLMVMRGARHVPLWGKREMPAVFYEETRKDSN
jgi:hypothetical protein